MLADVAAVQRPMTEANRPISTVQRIKLRMLTTSIDRHTSNISGRITAVTSRTPRCSAEADAVTPVEIRAHQHTRHATSPRLWVPRRRVASGRFVSEHNIWMYARVAAWPHSPTDVDACAAQRLRASDGCCAGLVRGDRPSCCKHKASPAVPSAEHYASSPVLTAGLQP